MQDEDNIDIEDLVEYDDSIDSDDENAVALEDRLKELNLEDADAVWSVLTEDERNEFEALLNQGDVGAILPQWQPWWMYHRERKIVEEIDRKDSDVDALKKCPNLKLVPKFESLVVSTICIIYIQSKKYQEWFHIIDKHVCPIKYIFFKACVLR